MNSSKDTNGMWLLLSQPVSVVRVSYKQCTVPSAVPVSLGELRALFCLGSSEL